MRFNVGFNQKRVVCNTDRGLLDSRNNINSIRKRKHARFFFLKTTRTSDIHEVSKKKVLTQKVVVAFFPPKKPFAF